MCYVIYEWSPSLYQRCRWDFKFGWASGNVVGKICPPGWNRVTKFANNWKGGGA